MNGHPPEQQLGELEAKLEKLICLQCNERRPGSSECPEECLISACLRPQLADPRPSGQHTDGRVRLAVEILQKEWQTGLRPSDLAVRLKISTSRLSHLFKASVGMSLRRYIQVLRLRYAARLLITTELRVSEIGYHVGFSRPANFSHAFRVLFESTPSVFRIQARGELGSGMQRRAKRM